VIVSRLESQKRLHLAVDIFARVLERAPTATLDIYGQGSLHASLQEQIDRLKIGHAVRLRGHDPQARETLWTATAFLMTSGFEGYPLATLESLSHGCPVISYDIKYGPREQVTDGVDGFIVDAGDQETFARRILTLVDDPGLVRSMSAAAYKKADLHDYRAFLLDWRRVIETVIKQKRARVKVESIVADVEKMSFGPTGVASRLPVRLGVAASSFRRPRMLELTVRVAVTGGGRTADPDTASIRLDALVERSAQMVTLPVRVDRSGTVWEVVASVDVAGLFAATSRPHESVRFRLSFTWNNYSWSTIVTRPPPQRSGYEVTFDAQGVMRVWSHRAADGSVPSGL